MDNAIGIFSGSTSNKLAKRICHNLSLPQGQSETIVFSEGNTYVKVLETVRGQDTFLIQSIGLDPNNEFVEILFWLDSFKRASANSVTLVMPYFGYSKGDKKDEPRVSIRARVCAECLELAGADRIVAMDLHAPQIQGFFKKPVDHLYSYPLLCQYLKQYDLDNFTVVSPDAGYAKDARSYARYLELPLAIANKERLGHDENTKVLEIIGYQDGSSALIVDDFSISGNTLINLAVELKNRGAEQIIACISHILFDEQAVSNIKNSPIDLIVSTDSVENPHVINSSKIKIVSCSQLLSETILRIYNKESVSVLFDKLPTELIVEEIE